VALTLTLQHYSNWAISGPVIPDSGSGAALIGFLPVHLNRILSDV